MSVETEKEFLIKYTQCKCRFFVFDQLARKSTGGDVSVLLILYEWRVRTPGVYRSPGVSLYFVSLLEIIRYDCFIFNFVLYKRRSRQISFFSRIEIYSYRITCFE